MSFFSIPCALPSRKFCYFSSCNETFFLSKKNKLLIRNNFIILKHTSHRNKMFPIGTIFLLLLPSFQLHVVINGLLKVALLNHMNASICHIIRRFSIEINWKRPNTLLSTVTPGFEKNTRCITYVRQDQVSHIWKTSSVNISKKMFQQCK